MTPHQIRESMRDRMWSIKSIAAFYEVSVTKAWYIVKQPGFPGRVLNNPHAWEEDAVRSWAYSRVEREHSEPEPTCLYRHYDKSGALLYVGIARDHLKRLYAHTATSGWRHEISRIDIERFPSREDAIAAESAAIVAERPLHNRAGVAK